MTYSAVGGSSEELLEDTILQSQYTFEIMVVALIRYKVTMASATDSNLFIC